MTQAGLEQLPADLSLLLNRIQHAWVAVEPRMPTEDEIMAYVVDVETCIKDDPTSAREALRRLLLDGRLMMHPQADGSWRWESAVLPMNLGGSTPKPQAGGPTGASGTDKVENGCCAGRI